MGRVMTIQQFAEFTKKLPKELQKMGMDLPTTLAKGMQRNIRVMATGRLKRTEAVRKGKNHIQIKYPNDEIGKIARFVNKGSYPRHPIPALLIEASRAGRPTAGKKSKNVLGNLTSQEITETGGYVQPKPSRTKGFLDNAYTNLKKETPKLIEREFQKRINAI